MKFVRNDNENEEQFLWRLGQQKDMGLIDCSWEDIADIMNKEFRDDVSEYKSEAAYRKPYQQAKRFFEANVFECENNDDEHIHEIKKETQKLRDERTSLNKTLREQGRRESLYDVVKRTFNDCEIEPFEYTPKEIEYSDNDVIIHLTDVHTGMEVDSVFNVFNKEVLAKRLRKYLDEIREIKNTYNSENAYVILGGDFIHGLIHINSRIEAKENVISQIKIVSDLISGFINELSKLFGFVEVHTTAGNHGRVTANKEETSHGENLDMLVPYICAKDFSKDCNVKFIENYLDFDIAYFNVRGHNVYATHGDKDNNKNVVYHMTQFARKARLPLPDMCFLGHRHTNGMRTVDDVKVIESGCVGGMDNYAIEKRLVGSPEQIVVVVTEDKMIKALCDVQLD